MKRAFLVGFSPMTRVIVDVEDETLKNEYEFAKVVTAAREQIIKNGIADYLNSESVDEIVLDTECKYDENFDDE